MSTKTLSSIQALLLYICYIRMWLCIDQDGFLRIHNVKVIVMAFAGKIVNDAPSWTVVVPYLGPVRKAFLGLNNLFVIDSGHRHTILKMVGFLFLYITPKSSVD